MKIAFKIGQLDLDIKLNHRRMSADKLARRSSNILLLAKITVWCTLHKFAVEWMFMIIIV